MIETSPVPETHRRAQVVVFTHHDWFAIELLICSGTAGRTASFFEA